MSPRRVPVSRRERPAKAALSREAVIAVALRIMRDEGLEKVTMRRLASELDTGPASLYVYVTNTAELHGALLDELLSGLEAPAAGIAWRGGVVALLSQYTRMLFAHPSLARSVLTLRPSGPNYLRFVDSLLGLLLAGGVAARSAAWGVDLLLQLATATAAEQGTRDRSADAEGEVYLQAMAVREAAAAEYPSIDRVRDELFSGTGEERYRFAFDALLDGIAAAR
ncbi:TetR/AcrR family transcriptional regulator [Dactylosporangium matsuzakiense]|uniref:TetR/AcrR family transcriptional regulator n=1 Tax=Dactylosporangium matsuzakiense TaxID=53360 RepID=UPI0021C2909A|nr:TetR/AcrR family transcriptional regulator C-terminal domain-containing protein [Dactylosporangium matsuzakiense]UWZ42572.1 TetR/AcrR family transcriptional regulator C-terminal domain-containing protein [Dactylosporangium matsuzakiense]